MYKTGKIRKLKTRKENKTDSEERKKKHSTTLPKDNFSPESGGSVKPNTAMEAIKTHGTIRLKK